MAEPTYRCLACGTAHRGAPAAMVPRSSGAPRPVCEEGLLKFMPGRQELERFWLDYMKTSSAP